MEKKRKQDKQELPVELPAFFDAFKPGEITSDVGGSYTGNPAQGPEPVQDQDDL